MELGIEQTEMEIDVEQVVRDQIAVMHGAVRELTRAVLSTALNEAYQKRVAGLNLESRPLANELQVIEKNCAELRPRLEARHRIFERQIDELLAAGDDGAAAAKRAEMEEEGKGLCQLAEKIDALATRLNAIAEEEGRLAQKVFTEAFPLFPLATFAVIAATIELLDALKAGMYQFAEATGIQVRRPWLEQLIPSTMPGSDHKLYARMREWFP